MKPPVNDFLNYNINLTLLRANVITLLRANASEHYCELMLMRANVNVNVCLTLLRANVNVITITLLRAN